MKRTLFLAACALAVSALAAKAAPNSPELVIDVQSGQVIHADEATRYWYPASTTKMMTAYVALRAVKSGVIRLETPLVASSRAAAQRPSKIGIRPGQEITLDNALKILMVKSANDLAVVIAEGIGGSVPTFAQMMNNEAARLGMRESRFVNPHGFHDPNHFTSARDLAILGRALLTEFPEYRGYWGIGAVALGSRVMKNTNGLIGRYPGAEGMKTGFVCASGFNVVSVANRGGRELLTVVLGAGSGAERTIRAAQLLDKGFSSWGGGYGSVTGLASGAGYGAAPNMRGEICQRGRMHLLTDEDSGGAIAYAGLNSQGDSSASVYAVGMPQQTSTRVGSAGGGRPVLGPRAEFAAIPVYLGRAPGSTEVARGAGNGAAFAPKTATAFAATPAPARTAPRQAAVEDAEEAAPQAAAGGQPTRLLPAAITTAAPGAIGLRRGAATTTAARPGAIGAAPSAKGRPVANPAVKTAAKALPAKTVPAKAGAANKAAVAKTATARTPVAKAAAKTATAKTAAAKTPVAKAGKAAAD